MGWDRSRQPRQQVLRRLSRILRHQSINNNQCRHRLDNGHGTGHYARVMPSLGLKHTLLKPKRSRCLRLTDRRRRLERDTEIYRCTVCNTALDTARVVSFGGQALGAGGGAVAVLDLLGGDDEGVVVCGSGHFAALKAGTDLETLGCGDAEHSVGEFGFKFVETRFPETDGDVANHAGHGAADAVLIITEVFDKFGHALGGFGVGTPGWNEGVDGLSADCVYEFEEFGIRGGAGIFDACGKEVLVSNRGDKCHNFDIVR